MTTLKGPSSIPVIVPAGSERLCPTGCGTEMEPVEMNNADARAGRYKFRCPLDGFEYEQNYDPVDRGARWR